VLEAQIGKHEPHHVLSLSAAWHQVHHQVCNYTQHEYVGDSDAKHVELNEHAEKSRVNMSRDCAFDAEVHDPTERKLGEEDQHKFSLIHRLPDTLRDWYDNQLIKMLSH